MHVARTAADFRYSSREIALTIAAIKEHPRELSDDELVSRMTAIKEWIVVIFPGTRSRVTRVPGQWNGYPGIFQFYFSKFRQFPTLFQIPKIGPNIIT